MFQLIIENTEPVGEVTITFRNGEKRIVNIHASNTPSIFFINEKGEISKLVQDFQVRTTLSDQIVSDPANNERELTKEALRLAYQHTQKLLKYKADGVYRTAARHAVEKVFPNLSGKEREKKIDSIRNTNARKFSSKRRKPHKVHRNELPIYQPYSLQISRRSYGTE